MENYEQLLDEAYMHVKAVESKSERFEIPKAEGHVEGNKTIIINFFQVCSYFRRKPEHFLKFLLKELATPGQIEGERLVLNRKLLSQRINDKIELYAKEFVICRECKKPDTEIIKQDRFSFLHCLACGAKHSIGYRL